MKQFIAKEPEACDKRIVRKFLFLPRTFGRDSRWLEFADIEEMYIGDVWKEIDFKDNRTAAIEDQEKRAREERYSFLIAQHEDVIEEAVKMLYSGSYMHESAALRKCVQTIINRLAKDSRIKSQKNISRTA